MTVVSSSPAMHVSALAWLHHLSYLLRGMRELLSLAFLSPNCANPVPVTFPHRSWPPDPDPLSASLTQVCLHLSCSISGEFQMKSNKSWEKKNNYFKLLPTLLLGQSNTSSATLVSTGCPTDSCLVYLSPAPPRSCPAALTSCIKSSTKFLKWQTVLVFIILIWCLLTW